MSNDFIPVGTTGKNLQTYSNTVSGQLVHAEAVTLVDVNGAPITTLPVSGTFFQATQPVSIAATVPVSGTFFQATQPVSGPLTDTQLRATAVPVSGTVSTGGLTDTQLRATAVPVSNASLPLPTGAATEASLSATNPYRGTTTISGGSSGTVTVASGARVVSISAHATTAGTVSIFGVSVPVPAANGFSTGWDGIVGPGSIIFTGTDSYYVAVNQ